MKSDAIVCTVGMIQPTELAEMTSRLHRLTSNSEDCRPDFIAAANKTIRIATEDQVRLHAPYENASKTDIARIGRDLDIPYELTWSCYAGGDVHCGVCGTCTERIEAFWNAQVEDRTQYAKDGLSTALKWLRDAGKLEGPGPRAYRHAYA